MPILSSILAFDSHYQRDGSRYVTETHVDSAGLTHYMAYLWREGMDADAIMAARVALIQESLEQEEFDRILDGADFVLVHQTKAQFAARFRARFKDAAREEAARLATWLLDHIDDDTFTEAQVRNVFGLNATQYTNLMNRLNPMRDAYLAILAARGE